MNYTYSRKSDAVYIRIDPDLTPAFAKTESLDPSGHLVNIDFTADGRMIGIEVLEASATFSPEFLSAARQIDVE